MRPAPASPPSGLLLVARRGHVRRRAAVRRRRSRSSRSPLASRRVGVARRARRAGHARRSARGGWSRRSRSTSRVHVRAGPRRRCRAACLDELLLGHDVDAAGRRARAARARSTRGSRRRGRRRARRRRGRRARPARPRRRASCAATRARRGARAAARRAGPRSASAAATGATARARRGRPAMAAEVELDGVREHRPGTPASRIYWPALARGAGLMERRLRARGRRHAAHRARRARRREREEDLDAAVRAVASLAVALAREGGGVGVLLPGDRRPTVLDESLGGWPHLHARLALLSSRAAARRCNTLASRVGPGPLRRRARAGRARRARSSTRPPPARMLVVPGTIAGRRPAFTVAGCTGYDLEPRADARAGGGGMSAAAPPVPTQLRADPPASAPMRSRAVARRRAPARRRHGPLLVRLAACVALALFGAQAWADMVRPEAAGRLAARGGARRRARRRRPASPRRCARPRARRRARRRRARRRRRRAARARASRPTCCGPGTGTTCSAGSARASPRCPGLSVPYRGVDEWNRIAMLLGGTRARGRSGRCSRAGPGATGGRRARASRRSCSPCSTRCPRSSCAPTTRSSTGTIFALLLAAVLFAERLDAARRARGRGRRSAVALLVGAVVRAAPGRPRAVARLRVDRAVDRRARDDRVRRGTTATARWTGRATGARCCASARARRAYWKATTLADFDGARWREVRPQGVEDDPAGRGAEPALGPVAARLGAQPAHEPVRHRGDDAADRALAAVGRRPARPARSSPASGRCAAGTRTWPASTTRGPRAEQLAAAGTDYAPELWPYLSMQLPRERRRAGAPARPAVRLGRSERAPTASSCSRRSAREQPALGYYGRGYGERVGEQWVRDSAYARTYRLAQRLKAAVARRRTTTCAA